MHLNADDVQIKPSQAKRKQGVPEPDIVNETGTMVEHQTYTTNQTGTLIEYNYVKDEQPNYYFNNISNELYAGQVNFQKAKQAGKGGAGGSQPTNPISIQNQFMVNDNGTMVIYQKEAGTGYAASQNFGGEGADSEDEEDPEEDENGYGGESDEADEVEKVCARGGQPPCSDEYELEQTGTMVVNEAQEQLIKDTEFKKFMQQMSENSSISVHSSQATEKNDITAIHQTPSTASLLDLRPDKSKKSSECSSANLAAATNLSTELSGMNSSQIKSKI